MPEFEGDDVQHLIDDALAIPVEVWRYSARLGLYFQDGFGEGLTFDELAIRSDYVAGHDDAPRVRIEFGPPMDEADEEFDEEEGE